MIIRIKCRDCDFSIVGLIELFLLQSATTCTVVVLQSSLSTQYKWRSFVGNKTIIHSRPYILSFVLSGFVWFHQKEYYRKWKCEKTFISWGIQFTRNYNYALNVRAVM